MHIGREYYKRYLSDIDYAARTETICNRKAAFQNGFATHVQYNGTGVSYDYHDIMRPFDEARRKYQNAARQAEIKSLTNWLDALSVGQQWVLFGLADFSEEIRADFLRNHKVGLADHKHLTAQVMLDHARLFQEYINASEQGIPIIQPDIDLYPSFYKVALVRYEDATLVKLITGFHHTKYEPGVDLANFACESMIESDLY